MNTNPHTKMSQVNGAVTGRKPTDKAPEYLGVKALIISLSLLGTMGGWAALAVGQIKDAQAKQIEEALAKKIEQAESGPSHAARGVLLTEPTRNTRVAATTPMRTQSVAKNIPKLSVRIASVKPVPIVVANGNKKSTAQAPVLRDVPARVRTVARSRSSQ